ncbi:MAG TPA: hypothetical protein VGE50_01820 [Gammaproteobacteria bacterium]
MKLGMSGLLAMAVTIILAMPVQAEEGKPNWQTFKQEVKQTGRDIGKTGKEVGLEIADGAKKGGKAVKEFFTSDRSKGNAK